MTRVKICGITNWGDAKLAVDLGADALGFNFYAPSPRSVTPARAWDIIRRLPPLVSAVGVFVNWPAEAVSVLAHALRLESVQLHGKETPATVKQLAGKFRVIKAFAVRQGFALPPLTSYRKASAFLFDGFRHGLYGGTGEMADWQQARKASRYGRIILAGGIKPGNVARAIVEARPFAIDVASGVESEPGKKDPDLLRELMREVEFSKRAASRTLTRDLRDKE